MSDQNNTAKDAAAKAAALKAKRAAAAPAAPAAPTAPSEPVAATAPQAAPATPAAPAAPESAYAAPAPTDASVKNTAIIALVMAFVIPIVGIILGHTQLNSIKRTGVGAESEGLLKGALAVGYVITGLTALIVLGAFAALFAVSSMIPNY